MKKIKNAGWILLFGFVASMLLWASCQWLITSSANEHLYNDISKIPTQRIGVVPGCAEYLPGGSKNMFFLYRIEAAARLFKAGKIQYILVSGDNRTRYYNEPQAMTAALRRAGVPDARIYRDYAGFSTLDSVIRAKEVFGLQSFTMISQPFHNRRAIFIARHHEINAIGYNANSVPIRHAPKTWLREQLAIIKAVADVFLLQRQPYFLGKRIYIGEKENSEKHKLLTKKPSIETVHIDSAKK